MTRTTVDYGIDLGTTNSSIALLLGTSTEVVKNDLQSDVTPSVVYVDKQNRILVGQSAKDRSAEDPGNSARQFKLVMGSSEEYRLARSGRIWRPEELSAEVLKDLLRHVQQAKGESLTAAVISVPAAFDLPQCEATNRAARLAGLTQTPLVQEPVAAAMAYGFQDEGDDAFWLVYDLGGGTFDAAVIRLKDGIIQVVNHGGDRNLGGGLIDRDIALRILIPALEAEHPLGKVRSDPTQWRALIEKLEYYAEIAKIRLSRVETEYVDAIRPVCEDDRGHPVEAYLELKRADIERLIEPIVARTVEICRRVLTEKGLHPGDIAKLLLVGGPTYTPYLRERLADPKEGLGIPLEFSIDPMTVVARGAAVFAGTQRILEPGARPAAAGEFAVQLEYKPIGPDTEPLVGGKVTGPAGTDLGGYSIEFVNTSSTPAWRSGPLPLEKDGVFTTELWAGKGHQNVYRIELADSKGRLVPISPNELTYTVGQAITDPPLTHSMGVALANNEVQWFFSKGTPLPARKRITLKTAITVEPGAAAEIRIPVVEGEYSKADVNTLIGALVIPAQSITRRVPAGSDVEVTIAVDQSRLLTTKAYLPILDEEFDEVIRLGHEKADPLRLKEDLRKERERLARAKERAKEVGDRTVEARAEELGETEVTREIETSLERGMEDPAATGRADARLRELRHSIDELEDAIAWPALVAELEEALVSTRGLVQEYGDSRAKQAFSGLEREAEEARGARDADLLRRKLEAIKSLGLELLLRQPGFWVSLLENLEGRRAEVTDPRLADELFARGRRSINAGDLHGLQAAVRQLYGLLPERSREEFSRGYGSTLLQGML